jgi:hypothetical protein
VRRGERKGHDGGETDAAGAPDGHILADGRPTDVD